MRRSLLISGGSFSIFVTHPISMALIGMFALLVLGQTVVMFRKKPLINN